MSYNRQQLYALIWSKPFAAAAADCGITTSVLRQIGLIYQIPTPYGDYRDYKEPLELPEGEDFVLSEAIAAAVNALHFPGESTQSFLVSRKLKDPDPLILRAQNSVRQDHQLHGLDHMLRAGCGELAVRSSKSNLDRALRIMDTLVKLWRHRGYRIENQDKETTVYLGIRETTKTKPSKEHFGTRTHTATGLLAFKVDGHLSR